MKDNKLLWILFHSVLYYLWVVFIEFNFNPLTMGYLGRFLLGIGVLVAYWEVLKYFKQSLTWKI